MRIAFAGKGGSGKTTMAALFSQFLKDQKIGNILSIDADINVNLPELLIGAEFPKSKFLSSPDSANRIKLNLLGKNNASPETFRKTTPPTKESNLVKIDDLSNPIISDFSIDADGIRVMAVGTYESEGIGASCYHNNLSILENILSHMVDRNGAVIVDMVAGTDSFASTLHSQFDTIILVVEPTRKGLELFKQFNSLAESAGIDKEFFVMGNKISSEEDEKFLTENIPPKKIIGFISQSDYIKKHDKAGGEIDFGLLEEKNKEVFYDVFDTIIKNLKDPNIRLNKLKEIHKVYVSQPFIKERFGDLTSQIDPEFKF
jgi:CO dehydrogenase maturation factor